MSFLYRKITLLPLLLKAFPYKVNYVIDYSPKLNKMIIPLNGIDLMPAAKAKLNIP
jgi:hypothetical protein